MRLLIATAGTATDPAALPAGVAALLDVATDIHVVSATLVSKLAWLTGGVDEARRSADERLDEVLGQVDRTGVAVSGSRGDELPMTAFADAIREFDAEHILVAIPQTHSKVWQDKNLVEKLWSRFELPITVFKLA